MSRIIGKKRALLGIVASLAIAAAAFAYWTTTGGGSGTATTQDESDIDDLTVSQAGLAEMFPGDSAQPITVTVSNPSSNDASIRVASVTASKSSVSNGGSTCDVDDYTLASPTMGPAQEIAAGSTADFSGATVKFNNKPGENQDDCKGATLNLSYTVNGS